MSVLDLCIPSPAGWSSEGRSLGVQGIRWRWGRLMDEGRPWPTFRLSQALVDMVADGYGRRERAILMAVIAWGQGLDGSPKEIVLPDGYLERVTRAHNRAWVEEGLETLTSVAVTCNAFHGDRMVGRKVSACLLERAEGFPPTIRFAPDLVEHILWPRQYALVELATVVALRSKYGLALYPMLCAEAGRAFHQWPNANLSMDRLAEIMGHRGAFGAFRTEALVPALTDIVENGKPERFNLRQGTEFGTVRDTGRGRRVISVVIPLAVPREKVRDIDKLPRPLVDRMLDSAARSAKAIPCDADREDFDDWGPSWGEEEIAALMAAVEETLGPLDEILMGDTVQGEKQTASTTPIALNVFPISPDDDQPETSDGWYFDEIVDWWVERRSAPTAPETHTDAIRA